MMKASTGRLTSKLSYSGIGPCLEGISSIAISFDHQCKQGERNHFEKKKKMDNACRYKEYFQGTSLLKLPIWSKVI